MNTNCYPTLHTNLSPNRLLRLAESLFNEARTTAPAWTPLADVSETESSYVLKLDLPSVKIEDVKVSVREGVLSVKGERHSEKSPEQETVHLQERSSGNFSRSFTLPKNADAEKVAADYQQGTLTITVPKRPEIQPKEITVRVA